MKFLYLKTRNHPVLGDQNLDLTSNTKSPLKMIIFAGENGVGKSTLMEMIYDFCNLSTPALSDGELREVTIFLTLTEINSIRFPGHTIPSLQNVTDDVSITLGFDSAVNESAGHFYMKVGYEEKTYCRAFLKSYHAKRIMAAIYMDNNPFRKRVGNREKYKKKGCASRRLSEEKKFDAQKGIIELYTTLEHQEKLSQREMIFSNLRKISLSKEAILLPLNAAIEQLLPSITIHGLSSNRQTVLVKKDGHVFSFNALSSGERQLFEMTSFLTYDITNSTGAPVLIDEPENNLHPGLQLALRSFLNKLFQGDTQIFMVTHSPFVIHDVPKSDERVFIFERKDQAIIISPSGEYYTWEHRRRVNEAFRIDNLYDDLLNTPLILVEGDTDEKYLNEVKKLFYPDVNIKIEWVGSYNANGNVVFSGSSALDKVKEFFLSNKNIIKNKLMLLYDCDVNIAPAKHGNLYIAKISENNTATVMNKGIENSLCLPDDLRLDSFYTSRTSTKSYGEETTVKTFNKKEFAAYICSQNVKAKIDCFRWLKDMFGQLLQRLDK